MLARTIALLALGVLALLAAPLAAGAQQTGKVYRVGLALTILPCDR